ncbi:hypothetical protein [Burkholderia sp. BCC1977]|uniref:hypothetical protein n=1 Tax=Burkholderia sp. BCC1977 TaxID=2817440 RepID=UPI002ABE79C5|nr:hypothetical protein [Burkholderia sp. BCC1977]
MNLELNCVRVLHHAQSKCFGFQCRRACGTVRGTLRGRVAASRDAGVGVMRDTVFGRGRRADRKVYRCTVRNGMTDT